MYGSIVLAGVRVILVTATRNATIKTRSILHDGNNLYEIVLVCIKNKAAEYTIKKSTKLEI